MTKKTFQKYKMAVVVVVGLITGVSVPNDNWQLPIVTIIIAWVLLSFLRGRVRDVIADERDYRLVGKASLYAITTYNMLAVIIGLILYISGKHDAVLYSVGNTLLYSVGFLMVIYTILFKIYERKGEQD